MNRFRWWAMSVFSSALVCISLAYNFYKDDVMMQKRETTVISVYSIPVVLSIGGVFTSMCSKGTMKKWFETILILSNVIICIMLGIATLVGFSLLGVNNGLVVTTSADQYEIIAPNAYFFTFASVYNAIYLASSWFKEYILRDENALTTTLWTFMSASGMIVMMTGISDFKLCGSFAAVDDHQFNDTFFSCPDVLLSIIFGLVTFATGVILLPWRSAPLKCQAELALILLVLWAVAIVTLTIGKGPAVHIGTMYIGILLCFFTALKIITTALYADSVMKASPNLQVEFGRSESENRWGAAGFLELAYANIDHSRDLDSDDDPRNADLSTAMLFESVGGSMHSLDVNRSSSQRDLDTTVNRKVVVGKRELSRIEIWFVLFVESIVCFAVYHGEIDQTKPLQQQRIIMIPIVSIILSFIGWLASSIKKKIFCIIEGILILTCISIWCLGIVAVTSYFRDDTSNIGGMKTMTANQLFTSYGSFFTSLYLITNWSNASVTSTDWIFLTASSGTAFVVLFIGRDYHTGDDDCGPACLAVDWQIMFALASMCLSFLMVFISFCRCERLMPVFQFIVGMGMLSFWMYGLYLIVFSADGAGAEVGPLFFACWGSLFFCLDIALTNLVMLCKSRLDDDEIELACSQDEDDIAEGEEENQMVDSKEDIYTDDYPPDDESIIDSQIEGEFRRLSMIHEHFDEAQDSEHSTLNTPTA